MKVMKRVIILLGILVLLSGCSNINKLNYDEIIAGVVYGKYDIYNTHRTGYKYYIPSNMASIDRDEYNEILADSNSNYYFYVDVVSYYNRVIEPYEVNPNAYFSQVLNFQDKYGYIEINVLKEKQYLLEIMYNYAKIELIVDECNLKNAINNSIIVLSSVSYNNEILDNLVGDNVLTSREIDFNIFETKKVESNFLEVESNDVYDDVGETYDPDLID